MKKAEAFHAAASFCPFRTYLPSLLNQLSPNLIPTTAAVIAAIDGTTITRTEKS